MFSGNWWDNSVWYSVWLFHGMRLIPIVYRRNIHCILINHILKYATVQDRGSNHLTVVKISIWNEILILGLIWEWSKILLWSLITYYILFQAYVEREKGKVVLYTTSLGIVRETFTNCMKMKQMLWTNMVKYDEADLFRDTELQTELKDRTDSEVVTLPQLFVDGQYIGVCMDFYASNLLLEEKWEGSVNEETIKNMF